jgi:hypothetical protein
MLTNDAAKWMVACLDPYHDNQLEVEGLPDERTSPSVVQVHNQRVTITAPTSAGANNWDASVLYTGFNAAINPLYNTVGGMMTEANSLTHEYTTNGLSTGNPFGALNMWAGASGTSMSTGAPRAVGDMYTCLGSVLETDRCRIIGVAFEVHNTTAEIYKQGSLTVACLPDVATDNGIVTYWDNSGLRPEDDVMIKQCDRAMLQACTASALQAVPGASTWPAAKGVYAIPRMAEIPRKIESLKISEDPYGGYYSNTHIPILYGSDGKVATPEPCGAVTRGVGPIPTTLPWAAASFSPLQIFFSGLSPQTSLTVTFRTIVEYFPAVGSNLLPLATPSPAFDPLAFELYAKTIMTAPYAVQVGMNSAGDYFRNVLKIVGTVATTLSPLAGSYAPAVAAGGAFASALGRIGGKPIARDSAGASSRFAPVRPGEKGKGKQKPAPNRNNKSNTDS